MPQHSFTILHAGLADTIDPQTTLSMETAKQVFDYFRDSRLFKWTGSHNDCEDRANAVCILLDSWGIPNHKGWVFSGSFLGHQCGYLRNYWKYHVAAAVPVQSAEGRGFLMIDPATTNAPVSLEAWALNVTEWGASYHFIKDGTVYIYNARGIEKNNWHHRDRRNFNWTVQGLSGINGASVVGRAQLAFHKKRIARIERVFRKLQYGPSPINPL